MRIIKRIIWVSILYFMFLILAYFPLPGRDLSNIEIFLISNLMLGVILLITGIGLSAMHLIEDEW